MTITYWTISHTWIVFGEEEKWRYGSQQSIDALKMIKMNLPSFCPPLLSSRPLGRSILRSAIGNRWQAHACTLSLCVLPLDRVVFVFMSWRSNGRLSIASLWKRSHQEIPPCNCFVIGDWLVLDWFFMHRANILKIPKLLITVLGSPLIHSSRETKWGPVRACSLCW